MKLVPLLFGLSLVANAALLVVVCRPALSKSTTASVSSDSIPKSPHSPGVDDSAINAKGLDQASTQAAVSWPKLQSASLSDMVAQLRAAGFSTLAIRGILFARLNDQMAAKRKALFDGVEETPFWKVKRPMFDAKLMMAQREYYQEQNKIIKDLLGTDASLRDEMSEYFQKRQFGDLPVEKVEKLQRVLGDYGDLTSNIYSEANGLLVPEDREKISYLEKEMREDLAEILTPEELENYELRSSSIAHNLRYQLTTFQPTEAEFRALFRATRAIADKYGATEMATTPEQRQQRTAALNEQVKLSLAPDRYAQYVQATNPETSMLNRVVARYNLPETVVPQVTDVQKDIQLRAAALRQLPPAEQAPKALALQQEATSKLKPLLGDNAYEAYKIYGGQWVDQLTRPPMGNPSAGSSAGAPKAAPKG